MTESENLFERYCRERKIEIRRLEECSVETPDYEIQIGPLIAAVEIKQLEPNAEDKKVIDQLRQGRPVAHWENMERPRNSLHDAVDQLRTYSQRTLQPMPGIVVLFDTLGGLLGYLDSDNIAQCMYGPKCFHFGVVASDSEPSQDGLEFLGASLGGRRIVTEQHNTTLSAVAVLKRSAEQLSLTVFHNKYAALPIAPSDFRVPDVTHFSYLADDPCTLPRWVKV